MAKPEAIKQQFALEVCRDMGMDQWDAQIVADMVDRPEAAWPICCGSGCAPCAEDLGCAARRVKERLAKSEAPAADPSPPKDS